MGRRQGAWRSNSNQGENRKKREAGFTLIEVLGALLVASLMLALLAGLAQRGSVWMEQASVAAHLAEVAKGFEAYAKTREAELLSQATASSGPSITTDDLVREGFLPQGFLATNLWNQGYQLYVRRITLSPPEDEDSGEGGEEDGTLSRLALLVLTFGGRGSTYDADNATFFNVHVPGAAARAGAHAGFIPGSARDGADSTHLVSGQGSYVLPLADLGIASPGPGHLGAYMVLGAQEESDTENFLHRVAVPGRPELNQMETILDMTGQAIVNTGFLQLAPHELDAGSSPLEGQGAVCSEEDLGRLFLDKNYGLYVCRLVRQQGGSSQAQLALVSDSANALAVQGMTLAADNELVKKPVCATGTGTSPQIFVAPAMASSGPRSPAMAALRAYATSHDEQHWQVHIRVKNTEYDEESWYEPGQESQGSLAYGAVQVITACVRAEQNPAGNTEEDYGGR